METAVFHKECTVHYVIVHSFKDMPDPHQINLPIKKEEDN